MLSQVMLSQLAVTLDRMDWRLPLLTVKIGVYMKSVMISGIEVAVDDENRYLQLDDVLDIAPEMWRLISERYTGYEAMFCYHNTSTRYRRLMLQKKG